MELNKQIPLLLVHVIVGQVYESLLTVAKFEKAKVRLFGVVFDRYKNFDD